MSDELKDIKSIEISAECLSNNQKNINYLINGDTIFPVQNKIIETKEDEENLYVLEEGESVNDFRLVKLSNGQYSFIDKNNKLVPYKYDLALPFNKFGLSMVCRNGGVTWINKDFKILNFDGELVDDNISDSILINGFSRIDNFNNSKYPLSRVYIKNDDITKEDIVAYVDTNCKFKKFYKFDGSIDKDRFDEFFNSGSNFDNKGHAITNDEYLFSKGYYVSNNDLIKYMESEGLINNIENNINNSKKLILNKN